MSGLSEFAMSIIPDGASPSCSSIHLLIPIPARLILRNTQEQCRLEKEHGPREVYSSVRWYPIQQSAEIPGEIESCLFQKTRMKLKASNQINENFPGPELVFSLSGHRSEIEKFS